MIKPAEKLFESRAEMVHYITQKTKSLLKKKILATGSASIFVSGGSTPKPFYQALSKANIDWSSIKVIMVDERWVPSNNQASNERFIRENLLQNNAKNATLITMKNHRDSAKLAQTEINQHYHQLRPPYDAMILGMGIDGHIASLFPHSKGLSNALSNKTLLCTAIEAIPSEATGKFLERMSITLATIKRCEAIILMITGEEKLKTYQRAVAGKDIFEMPVRALFQQTKVPVVVYWAP